MEIKNTKLLDFLSDWGGVIVFVYFLITALFGLTYRHLHNQQYIFTATYIGPFIAILVGYISLYRLQFQKKPLQKLAIFLGAIFSWLALCFGTAGIVVLLNSKIGYQEDHCLSGVIIEKWENKSFSGGFYNFRLIDREKNKSFSVDMGKEIYNHYKVGDLYRECWLKGSLGLVYK